MRAEVGGFQACAFGLVQPELQQDVVGFERGVGGQLAAPETLGRLLGKQGRTGAPDGRRDGFVVATRRGELNAGTGSDDVVPLVRHADIL